MRWKVSVVVFGGIPILALKLLNDVVRKIPNLGTRLIHVGPGLVRIQCEFDLNLVRRWFLGFRHGDPAPRETRTN